MADDKKYPAFDVFAVSERDKQDDWFTKVGAGWNAKDDRIVITLYALPTGNQPRLVLRPYKPPEKKDDYAA